MATWSSISPAVRLRATPPMPEAQKMQPMAQPTWLLTHTVWRARRTRRGSGGTGS